MKRVNFQKASVSFNPAGSSLRLGYWMTVWAQLTHLSLQITLSHTQMTLAKIKPGIARKLLPFVGNVKQGGKLDIGHWPENQELT